MPPYSIPTCTEAVCPEMTMAVTTLVGPPSRLHVTRYCPGGIDARAGDPPKLRPPATIWSHLGLQRTERVPGLTPSPVEVSPPPDFSCVDGAFAGGSCLTTLTVLVTGGEDAGGADSRASISLGTKISEVGG